MQASMPSPINFWIPVYYTADGTGMAAVLYNLLFKILIWGVKLKKLFKGLILGFLICYILAVCSLLLSGAISGYTKADYAVVLGNQVQINGKPSERLAARLDKAIELYNKSFVTSIIVSGGFGKEGFDEAIVMKAYLIEHQIPADKIITDSKGDNTYLTAENVKNLVGPNASIIVVSQLYHIVRSKIAFKQVGFKNIGAAYPPYFEWRDLFSINRELIAIPYYYFKHRENVLALGPDGLSELKLGIRWQRGNALDRLVRFSGNPESFDGCIEGKLLAANGASTEPFAGIYLSKKLGLVSISLLKGMRTQEGVGIGSTVTQVKTAYPDFDENMLANNGAPKTQIPVVAVPGNNNAHYEIDFIQSKVIALQLVLNGEDCFN